MAKKDENNNKNNNSGNNGQGMYNFPGMMDDFMKNGSQEALDTFQAGAVQSSMDAQIAQMLAASNAGIATR